MKTIQIPIPEGKKAEWVDGVLTLVDEKPQDITGRIKTFDDAVKWCDENDRGYLVTEYEHVNRTGCGMSDDVEAYMVLRIITCALNEGWKPSDKEKEVFMPQLYGVGADCFTATCTGVYGDSAAKLLFKDKKLAAYAATQFRDIYADFCGSKKGGGK